jgi:release factor glutamine methyltransferase
MFIKDNSIHSVINYFEEKLSKTFSSREIKLIVRSFISKRLGWESSDFISRKEEKVSESDLLFFKEKINQLLDGVPFQYALGETFFYNVLLKTDKRALIPRPETEELVDWIVNEHKDQKDLRILDVGTGSGCIPLAIKSVITKAKVSGIDVDSEALTLAKENSNHLNLAVEFFQHDILATEELDMEWDIIVSNPPYIPIKEKSEMAKHVLEYEPELALFTTNENPLVFYEKIADFATRKLSENGWLYFEIHESNADQVVRDLENKNFQAITVKKDLQGKDRMIRCKR